MCEEFGLLAFVSWLRVGLLIYGDFTGDRFYDGWD